jgi:hypothetical protein
MAANLRLMFSPPIGQTLIENAADEAYPASMN